MVKYISDVVGALKVRANGILKNATLWASMPVSVEIINQAIEELEEVEKEIMEAESVLSQLRAQGRRLAAKKQELVNQVDSLALGVHATAPDLLSDYGIEARRAAEQRPVPVKGMIKEIVDDLDGEGFILERDTLAGATNYEWQRAIGADAAVTNIDESEFNHFKITNKRTFVDDEVRKGTRYFYRFRGFNATGNGPWSEPVSRVQ